MTTWVRRALHFATAVTLLVVMDFLCQPGAWAGTLDTARARGHLVCGVSDGPKGYSFLDAQAAWSGIGVDFCRALAAAVLGNKDAVRFRPLMASERFAALTSGEVDVLSRHLGMTASHDTAHGIRFPGVLVYSGQGFLVRKAQGVASALELSGARICVAAEESSEQGLADFFGTLKLPYELAKSDKWQDAVAAYTSKGCQVLSAEMTILADTRQQLAEPGEHLILPEVAARQLIGPAVRQGDEDWFSVVRWTIYALIAAEELGITSANVDAVKTSGGAQARRFLAGALDLGERSGLSAEWTQRIVKQVGNYGELFDRNLGARSALRLERRLNNIAANGGLHYAPSFR